MSKIDWSQIRVLVVEDEQDLRETLIFLFQNRKAEVHAASNGLEALEILAQHHVHLVVSDVKMPECDGLEMLKRIREKNPDLPVVFLATGFADIDEKEAKARGAAGLMHKPFRINDFMKTLESALETSGLMPKKAC